MVRSPVDADLTDLRSVPYNQNRRSVTGGMRNIRVRHKLSIGLVVLALVPLIAAGLIVQALLIHNEVTKVDSKLATGAAAASTAYRGQLAQAQSAAMQRLSRP